MKDQYIALWGKKTVCRALRICFVQPGTISFENLRIRCVATFGLNDEMIFHHGYKCDYF